jgi:hypothetical protein
VSTVTVRPMSMLRVDFVELYARHLYRHSQFGINIVHLASLFGTWFGVYGLVYALIHLEWLPALLAGVYWMLIALNAPVRVSLASAVFLALFVAAVLWVPELPIWLYLVMIPLFYEVQSLSHKVWTAETDMTEINRKYPKGFVLFVVLLINEVPMVLNYLLFDRKSWKPLAA